MSPNVSLNEIKTPAPCFLLFLSSLFHRHHCNPYTPHWVTPLSKEQQPVAADLSHAFSLCPRQSHCPSLPLTPLGPQSVFTLSHTFPRTPREHQEVLSLFTVTGHRFLISFSTQWKSSLICLLPWPSHPSSSATGQKPFPVPRKCLH